MLVKAKRDTELDTSPPLSTWSAEVGVLADLVDAVNALRLVLIQVNSKQGAQKPKFAPYERPRTVMEKVRNQERAANHRRLVAKVLPHKRRES